MITLTIINLPVKNPEAAKQFFLAIGLTLNTQMSDEQATCFDVGQSTHVALLPEQHYREATKRDLIDTTKTSEVLLSIGLHSKEHVDELMSKALSAGAVETQDAVDMDVIYGRSFADLDGHLWNVFAMKS